MILIFLKKLKKINFLLIMHCIVHVCSFVLIERKEIIIAKREIQLRNKLYSLPMFHTFTLIIL